MTQRSIVRALRPPFPKWTGCLCRHCGSLEAKRFVKRETNRRLRRQRTLFIHEQLS